MPLFAVGASTIIVDAPIVSDAVPTIIRESHVTANTADWCISIYSLVPASLLITLGHTGDVRGRRRLFLTGTLVFVAAGLVAATAPNGSVLTLGRLLQGIGGAIILPATLSIVNAMFEGKDRTTAFALWCAPGAAPPSGCCTPTPAGRRSYRRPRMRKAIPPTRSHSRPQRSSPSACSPTWPYRPRPPRAPRSRTGSSRPGRRMRSSLRAGTNGTP
jgi:hypothetical protein